MAGKPKALPKRQCKAQTKRGERCKSPALTNDAYCSAHTPNLPEETRFGSPQQAARAGASAKPHVPKVIEAMREKVEEKVEEILAPYFEALEEATVHATFQGGVFTSEVRDLGARMDAAERLLDRVYGKPKQTAEVSGPDGGPMVVGGDLLDDPETAELIAALRRRIGARRAQQPGGPSPSN